MDLSSIGPRLRALRQGKDLTLAALSSSTGLSPSVLSRLESGARTPTLEQLITLAAAYETTLDALVAPAAVPDPRVHTTHFQREGMLVRPLTRQPSPMQAYTMLMPVSDAQPDLRVHEGWDWLYVLSGRLRLCLGDHDLVLGPGEAAEFDTRTPHWFGAHGLIPCEVITLFSRQGERIHLRASTGSPA